MTEYEARVRVIAAMCPTRVCQTCGEPSKRITADSYERRTAGGRVRTSAGATVEDPEKTRLRPRALATQSEPRINPSTATMVHGKADKIVTTLGFTDCGHDDWRPGVVLDPFQNQEEVMLTLGNIDERSD